MFKILSYIFLTLILIVFYSVVSLTMDQSIMTVVISVMILSLISFIYRKESNYNLRGQFFKHSSFFLLGYIIVHFQYYIDFVLGNVSSDNLYIWINKSVVIKSMILSLIGLLCFFIGYLLCKNISLKKIKTVSNTVVSVKYLLVLALISLIVFYLTVNPLYLAGFYGSEEMGASATYANLIFSLSVYSVIIQNCRNMIVSRNIPTTFKNYLREQGYFLVSLIGVYLLSVILSGDRGPLITFGICFVSGYFFVTKKKLSLKYGLLLVFTGAFLITLLGQVRSFDSSLDFSAKLSEAIKKEKTQNEISFIPQTQELAGSVRTLHTATNYLPEKQDFLYGRFQFQQFTVIIPFFNAYLESLFESNHPKYASSASFVTWINQGDFPTSGDGTSCIADFYIDFGLLGVVIGMLLFGYFIRYVEISMYSNTLPTLIIHVFGVVYLSTAVYISRSTVLFDLRSVAWILIILIINRSLLNKK